jgi:hypothetical protein
MLASALLQIPLEFEGTGHSSLGLVDSGAQTNYVDEVLVMTLNLQSTELSAGSQVNVRTVDGSVHTATKFVETRCKVQGTNVTFTLKAYVLALQGKHKLILGRPWLDALNPFVDWKKNRICIEGEWVRGVGYEQVRLVSPAAFKKLTRLTCSLALS